MQTSPHQITLTPAAPSPALAQLSLLERCRCVAVTHPGIFGEPDTVTITRCPLCLDAEAAAMWQALGADEAHAAVQDSMDAEDDARATEEQQHEWGTADDEVQS